MNRLTVIQDTRRHGCVRVGDRLPVIGVVGNLYARVTDVLTVATNGTARRVVVEYEMEMDQR